MKYDKSYCIEDASNDKHLVSVYTRTIDECRHLCYKDLRCNEFVWGHPPDTICKTYSIFCGRSSEDTKWNVYSIDRSESYCQWNGPLDAVLIMEGTICDATKRPQQLSKKI